MITRILARPAMKVCRASRSVALPTSSLFKVGGQLIQSIPRYFCAQPGNSKPTRTLYKPGTIVELKDDKEIGEFMNMKDKYIIISFTKEYPHSSNP